MAFPLSTLLITLLSISAAATSATALTSGAVLGGVITCTNASVALAGTYNVIPQAKVDLVCGGASSSLPAIIQSSQTNTAGLFNFVVGAADATLLDSGNCYLNVTIPPLSCILNVPTSTPVLRIPVMVLTRIDSLVGKIVVLVPGAITYLLAN